MLVELVSRSHHLDEDEPDADGLVAWSYEYDLLELRASNGITVVARTYTDKPKQVALLRFTDDGDPVDVEVVLERHTGVVTAFASFLRGMGFESVSRLGGPGYVNVPD